MNQSHIDEIDDYCEQIHELAVIIGGLAEDTKMARHCRTNTTYNLCTPCRDAMIMKESRCELINSAKPEKGRRSRLELDILYLLT